MYEAHFGLREKPFSILPDPKFLYLGREHRMAYSMLEYGIIDHAGFTVITGDIGSGKTTLVRKLIGEMQDRVTMALVSNTSASVGSLIQWIAMAFGLPFDDRSYPRLYQDLQQFLIDEKQAGRRCVLVIDEAQNLDPERLEELRMLSNVNVDRMLLQLVLVGQPELRTVLQTPEMKQFAQRISSDFHLQPLRRTDAVGYFTHRVKVAGGIPQLFTRPAMSLIFDYAGGVPRAMNVISDRCLVYAFGEGKGFVGQRTVRKVIADMKAYGGFAILSDLPVASQSNPVPVRRSV